MLQPWLRTPQVGLVVQEMGKHILRSVYGKAAYRCVAVLENKYPWPTIGELMGARI